MAIALTDFETWKAAVEPADRALAPEVPDTVAYALYEASRLQYLAAHRQHRTLGLSLTGEGKGPQSYELIPEDEARASNHQAREFASQVADYVETVGGPAAAMKSYHRGTLQRYEFKSFDHISPGNLALNRQGSGRPWREPKKDSIHFTVPYSLSQRLNRAYQHGTNVAREQLKEIIHSVVPGEREAHENLIRYMQELRDRRAEQNTGRT